MKHKFILPIILLFIIVLSLGYFLYSFFYHHETIAEISSMNTSISTGATDSITLENIEIISQVYTGILYNPIWQSRTFSGVYYEFGVGNPKELNTSERELLLALWNCGMHLPTQSECEEKILGTTSRYHYPSGEPHIPMVTPQIENLVASFFANPILLESSQSCAKYFWENDRDGKEYYPKEDMGEPSGWWNPYMIDINEFMKINPLSGRKEIELEVLWTFNTQIQFAPLKPDQRSHYPNMKLIECLDKNHLLKPLQKHVGEHYEKMNNIIYDGKL